MIEKEFKKQMKRLNKVLFRKFLSNPIKYFYMNKIMRNQKKQLVIRKKSSISIPTLLLISVTNKCNLRCVGCYFHSLKENTLKDELQTSDYQNIFSEASELGISMVTLVGGEPLLRKDILLLLSNYPNIIFSIYTNGLLLNEEHYNLFSKNRHVIPFLSLEGFSKSTNERRGVNVFDSIHNKMKELKKHHILFGVSVTITKQNQDEIMSYEFLKFLSDLNCFYVSYVEFEPFNESDYQYTISKEERSKHLELLKKRRKQFKNLFFTSYPALEYELGGCQAAGVGFIHINPFGEAEPCNFVNISDINIKNKTIKEVLNSKLFKKLRDSGMLNKTIDGECALVSKLEELRKEL